ncbi:TolC family protein [Alphaproteobacteria bacterium]|nr:TolC family protein [Alphaproteobacteria bacterium]
MQFGGKVIALTFAFALAPWSGSAASLSLEEVLIQSLKNSNKIASSRDSWIAARESVFASNATKESSLKYSGSGSLSEADSGSGYTDSDSYSNKITFSKNIFDGGQSRENLKLAEIQLERATASYRNTEQGVMLEAVQSYLNLSQSYQQVELQKNNITRLEKHVAAAKVNLVEGIGTPTSLAEAEARYARAKADRALFATSLENAKDLFSKLTFMQANTDLGEAQLLGIEKTLPQDRQEAEELALKNSPNVIIARLAERAAGQELHLAQAKQNPTLEFSLSATQSNTSDSISASISVSAPLYSTNSTISSARKKVALHSQSMRDLKEAIGNAKIEARSAFRDYEGAKITLNAVVAEVKASRLVVDGVSKELKYGLKTTLDLLDAEKAFNDAELRLVQARHDITLREFKLIAVTGGLTAKKLGIGHVLNKLSDSPRPENPLKKSLRFW